MVGLCGEFPSGQLNRLIESDSYAEKVVTDLKQNASGTVIVAQDCLCTSADPDHR